MDASGRATRHTRFLWLLVGALGHAACPAPEDKEAERAPSLYSGPDRYHDLTELNYVTIWAHDFDSRDAATRECVLNGQAQPCSALERPHPGGVTREKEYYLPALPFGENTFEVHAAGGSPVAVTHFVVCRRTMDIDFSTGADGKVETPDDRVELVHARSWKNHRVDWETITDAAGALTQETRIHSYEGSTTNTVEVFQQEALIGREVWRYTALGLPISSEAYSPEGALVAYTNACLTLTELTGTNYPYYTDGACSNSFAPSRAMSFGHPGTDMTWRTSDDHVLRVTDYLYQSGDGEWYRSAVSNGRWLRTIFTTPPTGYTTKQLWYKLATHREEVGEPDPVRPGLWRRTRLYAREPEHDSVLVGFRKYDYQCAP